MSTAEYPPLPEDDFAAIVARDDRAGDGLTVMDTDVWVDRHRLILEVRRLQALAGEGS